MHGVTFKLRITSCKGHIDQSEAYDISLLVREYGPKGADILKLVTFVSDIALTKICNSTNQMPKV